MMLVDERLVKHLNWEIREARTKARAIMSERDELLSRCDQYEQMLDTGRETMERLHIERDELRQKLDAIREAWREEKSCHEEYLARGLEEVGCDDTPFMDRLIASRDNMKLLLDELLKAQP
jgi:uncharacterized coiled-coil DUF342 family protein